TLSTLARSRRRCSVSGRCTERAAGTPRHATTTGASWICGKTPTLSCNRSSPRRALRSSSMLTLLGVLLAIPPSLSNARLRCEFGPRGLVALTDVVHHAVYRLTQGVPPHHW